MPKEVKMSGIQTQILQQLRVVHVAGEVVWHGEVAEAHHFLGGVDHKGAVRARTPWLRILLRNTALD